MAKNSKLGIVGFIGLKIKNFLEKKDTSNEIDPSLCLYVEVHITLEEAFSICDNDRYFHIVHKISETYRKDSNYLRLMEDINSWIEETPDEECKKGLMKLKKQLEY